MKTLSTSPVDRPDLRAPLRLRATCAVAVVLALAVLLAAVLAVGSFLGRSQRGALDRYGLLNSSPHSICSATIPLPKVCRAP